MSAPVISLLVLVVVFAVATVRNISMGALALVSAVIVGATVFNASLKDVLGGFPSSLFVILVGVTYLFGLARGNGTVDWIIHAAVRAVGGRVALIPWVMFLVTAIITAVGAVSPAAVAIIAPIAMGFAAQHRIHPVLMGMMVVQGATAGSFSPLGIFGSITNGVVDRSHLASNPFVLFITSFIAAVVSAVLAFFAFGGRELARRPLDAATATEFAAVTEQVSRTLGESVRGTQQHRVDTGFHRAAEDADPAPTLNVERGLTLAGIIVLAIGALILKWDVGITALGIATVLTLIFPKSAKGAVDRISWGTVLLVGGIVTYVALLEKQGVVKWLGDSVATIGSPMLVALLICVIGAFVSALASTTGILGALIPLAVPFLATGQVGAVGLIAALAISSSLVDCSPFSTNGALIVANSGEQDRDEVFKQLMIWGAGITILTPLITWGILVVPGWL